MAGAVCAVARRARAIIRSMASWGSLVVARVCHSGRLNRRQMPPRGPSNVLLLLMALLTAPQTTEVGWASPVQGQAFAYGPYPQCASGGFGSGKTWEGCMKGLWLSDTFPKNRGVIARRVGKELRATTQATFYKICPPSAYDEKLGGRRNDQEGYLKLNNGSEILFVHFEDPERQALLRGLEINWFLIDQAEEAPEIMEEVFDILRGRLLRWDVAEVPPWLVAEEAAAGRDWPWKNPATGKPLPPPYAMLACNPDTELHWIYRRFHPESHEHQETYAKLGYRMFDMPSEDNQFLPDANKAELLQHDDAFVRRYVKGLWGVPEGAIHLIPPESLIEGSPELIEYFRSHCTLHRVLDHGDSAPTCCLWFAVDRNGNAFAYREYYLPNALISTHRANLTGLSEYERYEFNLADPSIFHKEMQKYGGRWSVADEYADVLNLPPQNALFWQAADNNELGTRNRVNEYLRVDPVRLHPITKTPGSPRLFFVKANASHPQGIVHAITQTRAQRRVKVGTEMGRPLFSDERDETIVDHAYDPVRYFIASRAPLFADQVPTLVRGTFAYEQQRAKLQAQRQKIRGR